MNSIKEHLFNSFQFAWGIVSFFGVLMALYYFTTHWNWASLGAVVLCGLSSFLHLGVLWHLGKISGKE